MIGKQTTTAPDLASAFKARGLTQRRVAWLLDKPEATVSRWVRGQRPGPQNREALVRMLNETGRKAGLARLSVEDVWGRSDG